MILSLRLIGIKPPTVVGYLAFPAMFIGGDGHPQKTGMGMLQRIDHRLLNDPVCLACSRIVQRIGDSGAVDDTWHIVQGADFFGKRLDRQRVRLNLGASCRHVSTVHRSAG